MLIAGAIFAVVPHENNTPSLRASVGGLVKECQINDAASNICRAQQKMNVFYSVTDFISFYSNLLFNLYSIPVKLTVIHKLTQ